MKRHFLALTATFAVCFVERPVSALYSIGGLVNTMAPALTPNVTLYDGGRVCWTQAQNTSGFTTWSSAPRLGCNTVVDRVSWTPDNSFPVTCNYRVINGNRHSPQSIVLEALLVVENEGEQACVYHEAHGVGFNLPVYSKIDWATPCGSSSAPGSKEDTMKDFKARQTRIAKKIARQARGGTPTASSAFTVINLLPVDATLTVTAYATSGGPPDNTTPAPTPCAGPVHVSTASSSLYGVRPFGNGACMDAPASTYLLSAGLNDAGSGSASGVLGSCTITIDENGWSVFHSLSLLVSSLGVDGPLCVSAALAQESPLGNVTFSCPPC